MKTQKFKQKLQNAYCLFQRRKPPPFEAKTVLNPQSLGFKILALGLISPGKKKY